MILRCHFLLLLVILLQSKSLLISTDSSAIHFPEDGPPSAEENESPLEIPFELLDELNEVSNITDFYTRYVVDGISLANRMGEEENVERNAAMVPAFAKCKPVDEIVTLQPEGPVSTLMMYIPSCTRVKRCSGCCTNHLRKCEAVESEILSFKISANIYTGANRFERAGDQIVFVEQHKSCICGCRVKEADCNRFQIYNARQCRCDCSNVDDVKKCTESNRFWNSQRCACQCREVLDCTTGTFFDANTCQCTKDLPTGQGGSSLSPSQIADRRKFIIKAVTVSPNQEYETVN